MRPSLAALFLLLYGMRLPAQLCAATPEAAAQSAIGTGAPAAAGGSASGYRVQDVQVDAVMHRVWVRVSHCDDPSQPLVLVPMRATLASGTPVTQSSSPNTLGQQRTIASPVQIAAIHAGDAVKIFFASQSVQMEIEGTADTQAAIGEGVSVTLKRMRDEPPHRIRGVLRADHRVEVEPQ